MNETQTRGIGFADKLAATTTLVEQVRALVVTNAQEYAVAGEKVAAIREIEKELAAQYAEHPVIIEAKRLQGVKGDLAEKLEKARKAAKAKMISWEDAEEAKRRAEEARRQAEAQKAADDAAQAAALAAEKAGDKAEAESIIAEPVIAPVIVLPKATPKVSGHARRTVSKFRIINAALIPRQYLMPNDVAIGGVIRSLKAAANIPGVEYYEETV